MDKYSRYTSALEAVTAKSGEFQPRSSVVKHAVTILFFSLHAYPVTDKKNKKHERRENWQLARHRLSLIR